MTAILGISAFYHDSAAALIGDGRIVAAAQEERFTRVKHDAGFPKHAIDYCLSSAQTVDPGRHGRYHRLLERFYAKTGCPLIINTSFNVRGEPIVCTPEQAHRCFLATHIDALVLERFVLVKQRSDESPRDDAYLSQFSLD